MGMSKEEKALYSQLTAAIANMQNPKSNPAQDYLTNQALAGANFLQGNDYGTLPKGMFFNFDTPAKSIDQYKKYSNVGQGGTFALADNAGRGQAQQLQGKYLQDKFARDASDNFQNNISNAAGQIQGALGQSSGASSENQINSINALSSLFNSPKLKKTEIWGSLLGLGGQLGSAAFAAF